MTELTWGDVCAAARTTLAERGLGDLYRRRLEFEIREIDKQGSNAYWLKHIQAGSRWDKNPNYLVLPWLLGMCPDDPIAGREDKVVCTVKYADIMQILDRDGVLPPEIIQDMDKPDIDIDLLPEARDEIRAYATNRFRVETGDPESDDYGVVCSVGTWTTYLFKSALEDAARATGLCDYRQVQQLTTQLPEDVNELKDGGVSACRNKIRAADGSEKKCGTVHGLDACPQCGASDTDTPTIGQLLKEHPALAAFHQQYPLVVTAAVRLVGKIQTDSTHAGAIIITDRPLYGNIPLYRKSGTEQWRTIWTEGRNTQLSKFGYTKWDFLGLKTIKYIYECARLIEKNHGISFGHCLCELYNHDPADDRLGYYLDRDGTRHKISLNDPAALALANDLKTDTIFQFDTSLAKSILANGVRHFYDLMIFNAMGHPGPMDMIPDYVARRDDPKQSWKKTEHPLIVETLEETHGTIVFQEQLAALWQRIAGFTAPEAQEARKAVAKKWRDKLADIEKKWLAGATPVLGAAVAKEWWDKMESFGRYAFNRSHSAAYCVNAYICLWFKAHFTPEWWAPVMSHCNQDKLVRYINTCRAEGTPVSSFDITDLTVNFTATPEKVLPGLAGLKGVGVPTATPFAGRRQFTSIDDFVEQCGKDKKVLERLIKLGAFKSLPGHENSKALWTWYQYRYCSGPDITKLKQDINAAVLAAEGWTPERVEEERRRQEAEHRRLYPKRKVPDKILNWKPKPATDRVSVMATVTDDFTLKELLGFEKEYLGYTIHSPLDLFETSGECSIEEAKDPERIGEIEGVVENVHTSTTKNGNLMCRVTVTDGIQSATLVLWQSDYERQDKINLRRGAGIKATVQYDKGYGSFSLLRGSKLLPLKRKDE